jgi:hypothetical protein
LEIDHWLHLPALCRQTTTVGDQTRDQLHGKSRFKLVGMIKRSSKYRQILDPSLQYFSVVRGLVKQAGEMHPLLITK